MLCDLTITADNATFRRTRSAVFGSRSSDRDADDHRRALYFGDQIDAKTALDLGMINRIVPLAELGTASLGYAKRRSLISTDLGGWTCLLAWPMAIPGR